MENIKLVGDRLSLTLSLVAIISAAITSYYQFFHHATMVSHFQSEVIDHWPSLEGDHYQDSIAARVTFLNSGSTPVAIVKSRLFLTSDTLYALAEFKNAAKERKPYDPYKDPYNTSRGIRNFQTRFVDVNQEYYLKEQSVHTVRFSGVLPDSSDFRELLMGSAPLYEGAGENLSMGLWVLFADPYGDFSMKTIPLGQGFYRQGRFRGEFFPGTLETNRLPPFAEGSFWQKISDENSRRLFDR